MIAEPPSNPPPQKLVSRLRRREARRGTRCLNCDSPTDTRYCPECGQENVDVNISLWEIFREAIEEFVRFDSKLVRTLVPLVTKPGFLTMEWKRGRRTKYLSPLKLYLTITAIFFLIVPYLQVAAPASVATIKATKREATSRVEADLPLGLGFVVHQLNRVDHVDKRQFLDQFVQHVPTALFAMLPVFAGALWVIYARNRRFYVEHLVYALHVHSFLFLLLTVRIVLPTGSRNALVGILNAGLFIWAAAYTILSLKGAYGQGWGKTLIKWCLLGYAYFTFLGITLLGVTIAAAAAVPD